MTRWVRSYWAEEDVTFLWEVREDGWVSRGVELVGDGRAQVAASLDEWMRELDAGRIQQYQATYGFLTDQPIEDWDFPHEDLTLEDFDEVWLRARAELEAAGGPSGS